MGLQTATHDVTYAAVIHPQLEGAPADVRLAAIDGIPDPVLKARRIRVVNDGLAAPDVLTAMRYFKRSINLMDQRLEGNYVTGTNLTLADIAIAPYFFRLDQLTLSSLWGGSDSKVGQWYERMKTRDSFQKALVEMIPPAVADAFESSGKIAADQLIAMTRE